MGSQAGCLVPLSRKSKMSFFLCASISLRNTEFLAKVSVLDGCRSSCILFIRKVCGTFSSWALSSKNTCSLPFKAHFQWDPLLWWFVVPRWWYSTTVPELCYATSMVWKRRGLGYFLQSPLSLSLVLFLPTKLLPDATTEAGPGGCDIILLHYQVP